MKVFISYTSADKDFVSNLASQLRIFGINVWYDDWEIKVGDSIIDKVFNGLRKSDALIIVLSKASVKSRWVKEELNTAAIRKINKDDILILPILKENCEIPTVLSQLKYADFRKDLESGLYELLDVIEPLRTLWHSLKIFREQHSMVVTRIRNLDINDLVQDQVEKLYELMSSALDVRCQIEFRLAQEMSDHLDFFKKIDVLADKGIDVRSQTWNSLVRFRADLSHSARREYAAVRRLAYFFQDRYSSDDYRESLQKALDRLEDIMSLICGEANSSQLSIN